MATSGTSVTATVTPSTTSSSSAASYVAAQHITPHFQTGEYVAHTSFLPDDTYATLLVTCTHD